MVTNTMKMKLKAFRAAATVLRALPCVLLPDSVAADTFRESVIMAVDPRAAHDTDTRHKLVLCSGVPVCRDAPRVRPGPLRHIPQVRRFVRRLSARLHGHDARGADDRRVFDLRRTNLGVNRRPNTYY